MAQQTIVQVGAFTQDIADQVNDNFDELYAGTGGQTLASPTITGTVAGGATYTAPTFTTPVLGVASATSVNKVAITAPATSATLVIADGKTFTVNQTLTLTGTTGTTMTFPSTSATIARTDAANTFTGVQTMTSPVLTTPAIGAATGASLAVTGAITSSSASAGVGYATGAGGTGTQGTNRTTTVVMSPNPCLSGSITLISAAGSATPASFTVTDSAVAATDTIIVNQKSGTDLYEIFVTAVGTGSFRITSFTTGGTTTETPVFNFAVIKGVAA